jgi:hypothetical protein
MLLELGSGWENEVEANVISECSGSDLFLSSSPVRARPKLEDVASLLFLESTNSR